MDSYTPETAPPASGPPISQSLAEALSDAAVVPVPAADPAAPKYQIHVRLLEDDDEKFNVAVEHVETSEPHQLKKIFVVDELFEGVTMDTVRQVVNEGSKLVTVNDAVEEKIRRAKVVEEAARAVEKNRRRLANDFSALIAAARPKAGEQVDEVAVAAAAAKLRVFSNYSNEGVGMRMALMSRAQRRRLAANNRHAAGDEKRKAERVLRLNKKRNNRR